MDKEQLQGVIQKCRNGDKQAFKVLMLSFSDYVFALSFRILNNEEDARDVVQETFIRVWENIDRYKEEIKITTWMYKIATNLCFDKLKSSNRRLVVYNPDTEKLFNTLATENLSEQIDNRQLAEIIIQLAGNLTPKQKIVFVLKDIEGLETSEIEEISGMDKVQIKSNLYIARQQIRNRLIQKAYEMR